MRRSEREIKDRKVIDDMIRRSRVCRLAMCDEDRPYVVPLNFGYDGSFLYFHAAQEGRITKYALSLISSMILS